MDFAPRVLQLQGRWYFHCTDEEREAQEISARVWQSEDSQDEEGSLGSQLPPPSGFGVSQNEVQKPLRLNGPPGEP